MEAAEADRLRLVPRRLALCDVTSAGCHRDDGRHHYERVKAVIYNEPVRDHGEDEPESEQGQASWIQAAMRVRAMRRHRHALPSCD